MKVRPEQQEQVGAAQLGWGAGEEDPQVTEKEGVEQGVALVAGSQSSPLAAVSLPQVEASAEQGLPKEGNHSGHQAAEEQSKNLKGMADPGVPEAKVGQAKGWGRKLQSRGRMVEGRELPQQATSPALWLAVLRNPETGP